MLNKIIEFLAMGIKILSLIFNIITIVKKILDKFFKGGLNVIKRKIRKRKHISKNV
jgi:hypothetical protein